MPLLPLPPLISFTSHSFPSPAPATSHFLPFTLLSIRCLSSSFPSLTLSLRYLLFPSLTFSLLSLVAITAEQLLLPFYSSSPFTSLLSLFTMTASDPDFLFHSPFPSSCLFSLLVTISFHMFPVHTSLIHSLIHSCWFFSQLCIQPLAF